MKVQTCVPVRGQQDSYVPQMLDLTAKNTADRLMDEATAAK